MTNLNFLANKLHKEIMNIRCPSPFYPNPSESDRAYKEGHRDARHAAAELVLRILSESKIDSEGEDHTLLNLGD